MVVKFVFVYGKYLHATLDMSVWSALVRQTNYEDAAGGNLVVTAAC